MKEIVDISVFRNSIVLYQVSRFKAKIEYPNLPIGECMTFVKNNGRKKIILSTAHASLCVKGEELLKLAAKLLEEDALYSDSVEFYYPTTISSLDMKRITEMAEPFGINLIVYDYPKLYELEEFSTVFKQSFELETVTPAYRVLYDMLLEGSNVSEIKNSILYSMLIFAIYEEEKHEIHETVLEEKFREKFSQVSMNQALTYLTREKRIVPVKNRDGWFSLTEKEIINIESNIKKARRIETDFITQFNAILSKYCIDNVKCEGLILKLKQVYEENFKTNIQSPISAFDKKINITFNEFKEILKQDMEDDSLLDNLILDIRKLCTENAFLNRISASESFISLYDSPKLSKYLAQKCKHIFLDTPVLVYYICSKLGVITKEKKDWNNNLYIATKHLLGINQKTEADIKFHTIEHYIKEAAGELRKALRIDAYKKYGILYNVPDTGNTFYNYFQYLKENEYIDSKMSLAALLLQLGFQCVDPEDNSFIGKNTFIFKRLLNHNGIEYTNTEASHLYIDALAQYKELLWRDNKARTEYAMRSDVNLVLHLTSLYPGDNSEIDYYICSWDPTFIGLGKWVVNQDPKKYHMFSSYNPSKLANKLSYEKFNINAACITESIFAYADENYELSTRVRHLYDNELSVITNKENSLLFIDKLEKLKDKYLYQGEDDFDNEQRKDGISLGPILDYLTDKIKERHTEYEFGLFYKSEKGQKKIYESINLALDAQSKGEGFYTHIDSLVEDFSKFISKESERYQSYL